MKMFDSRKTGMIGLPYGGKTDVKQVFMQYQRVTDRRTDRQTDRITISISRVSSSMLMRDKNEMVKNEKIMNSLTKTKTKTRK